MSRYLPDDNLSYPVLIQFPDGSSGSGFYLNNQNKNFYFVTALHVLFKTENLDSLAPRGNKAKLISYDFGTKNQNIIELEINLSILNVKKDIINDIVLVEMGDFSIVDNKQIISFKPGIDKKSSNEGLIVTVIDTALKRYNDAMISNEVFILGYPNSLGIPEKSQIDYKRPLLRKGIIAGKNPERKIARHVSFGHPHFSFPLQIAGEYLC